jgi:aspartate racemase
MKKTIGILGGMGPEATAYFFGLITKKTKAETDQDHIPVVISSNPEIPPRMDAVLGKGPSLLPYLLEGVRVLKEAGADFIVMPCVTAHYFYDQVMAEVNVPFLHLVDETVLYALRKMPELKKAGLVASTGTLKSKLFHNTFGKEGVEIVEPGEEEQAQVMDAIFGKEGIKAGFTSGKSQEIIHHTVIAGCTEVPLVLRNEDIEVPLIEPLQILAEVAIVRAGYELRAE